MRICKFRYKKPDRAAECALYDFFVVEKTIKLFEIYFTAMHFYNGFLPRFYQVHIL